MKNIHILPTEKPSRIYKQVNKLKLRFIADSPIDSDISINQHIYITSDEEIKDGDWVFNFEYDYIVQYDSKKHDDKFWYKKIILTTDQDLIKDGVQAIDDEFLEWFVNNPSCESVKVDYDVIVTQTKALLQNQDNKTIAIPHCIHYKIIIPQEEPKQETLEEAAEKRVPISDKVWDLTQTRRNDFIAGAKWQAKRMYSEEEIKEAYWNRTDEMDVDGYWISDPEKDLEMLIEQFKKK
jgi:hypothetical protein